MELEKLNLRSLGQLSEQPYDPLVHGRMRADSYNEVGGDLTGLDCPKCRNKGQIAHPKDDGGLVFADCSCMKARRSIWKMEQSGLKNIIRDMTFDRFEAVEEWQQSIKNKAVGYAEKLDGWLLFCGQPGAGKTHLCTAVCRHRLLMEDEVRYMPWRDDVAQLKALSLDSEKRHKMIADLKTAPILYIDDFFKCGKSSDGSSSPTRADIDIAFEVLNYRYINRLPTIVSTEKSPQELLAIDEAIATRIFERAAGYTINIERDLKRNYRLRGVTTV